MSYQIRYEKQKRKLPWGLLLIPAAGLALLTRESWYGALAEYVGRSILGH